MLVDDDSVRAAFPSRFAASTDIDLRVVRVCETYLQLVIKSKRGDSSEMHEDTITFEIGTESAEPPTDCSSDSDDAGTVLQCARVRFSLMYPCMHTIFTFYRIQRKYARK